MVDFAVTLGSVTKTPDAARLAYVSSFTLSPLDDGFDACSPNRRSSLPSASHGPPNYLGHL